MHTLNPIHAQRRGHRPGGFTLTEVMFAVFIMGIGLISVAAVFPVALYNVKQTADDSAGVAYGRNILGMLQQRSSSGKLDAAGWPNGFSNFNPIDNSNPQDDPLWNFSKENPLDPLEPERRAEINTKTDPYFYELAAHGRDAAGLRDVAVFVHRRPPTVAPTPNLAANPNYVPANDPAATVGVATANVTVRGVGAAPDERGRLVGPIPDALRTRNQWVLLQDTTTHDAFVVRIARTDSDGNMYVDHPPRIDTDQILYLTGAGDLVEPAVAIVVGTLK